MNLESIYAGFLWTMFVFWNGVRIFTYLPTIRKLRAPGASAREYSLATWGSWALSNGFFALYLWEQSDRVVNSMVLLNIGNTAMCLFTSYLIWMLQRNASQEGTPEGWKSVVGCNRQSHSQTPNARGHS